MNKQNKPKHHFLQSKDFETGFIPSTEFLIEVECLDFDGDTQRNISLKAQYDRHLQLNFFYETEKTLRGANAVRDNITISGKYFPESISLLATKTRHHLKSGSKIDFVPATEPFLMDFDKEARRVEAVVINGPPLFFGSHEEIFLLKECAISLREFSSTSDFRKSHPKYKHDRIATGTLIMENLDGSAISPETAFNTIVHFSRFLTFVRGGYCGIGNVQAYGKNDEIAYAYLGFLRTDQFEIATGWSYGLKPNNLLEIYQLYQQAVSNRENTFTLLRAIEFYRASNAAHETSLEIGLIASYTALETLVPHLLSKRAGWSKELLGRRTSFHDKLRAAVVFIGINCDLCEHLPEFLKKSASEQNIDAFEMLSRFRNLIVHPRQGTKYTGIELFEAWSFSQWLCEIFLFYWLGYRGEMVDRRKRTRFKGESVPIPLPDL